MKFHENFPPPRNEELVAPLSYRHIISGHLYVHLKQLFLTSGGHQEICGASPCRAYNIRKFYQ